MHNRVTLVSDSVLHIWKLLREFSMGFPDGAVIKNLPANAGDIKDMDSIPRLGRSQGMATHYSVLDGESHGQRRLVSYSP